MQIYLSKLKSGDKINFGGEVEKTVCHICSDNNQIKSVSFTDGTILDQGNSLWRLAKLHSPSKLSFARLDDDGYYVGNRYIINYTPEAFLFLLKQDVAALEAAGVESRSIDLCKNS